MNLLRLLSLRSMKTRKTRYLLSMLGITIGVAGILALGISNQAAMGAITRLFEESSGKSDLMVTAASGDQGFEASILDEVARTSGVQLAAPVVVVNTAFPGLDSSALSQISMFGDVGGGLMLYGIDPSVDANVRNYVLNSGRFINGEEGLYEILLVENTAEDQGLELGDRVEILTPKGVEKFKLVGLLSREGVGQTNNGNFGVLNIDVAQIAFERRDVYDQLDLLLNEGTDSNAIESLRLTLQQKIGTDFTVTYPAGQGQRMSQMVSNYQIGLNFLSAIALFVGAYLIYNSFTMNVVERTREYGMLRTIGMTRRQITGMVLFDSLIIGAAGSVLGVLVGIFGSRGLASALGNVLGADLLADMRVPMGTLVLSLVIGIGVTVISAMIPAIQAGKISPIEALRIRGTQKEGWLSRHGGLVGIGMLLVSAVLLIWNPVPNDPQFRVGSMIVFTMFAGVTLIIPSTLPVWEKAFAWLIRAIYGGSGVIGQKNLERSKSRTTLTVSALLVGVAMILIVQSMTASFAGDLKVWVESYMGGDLYVTSSIPLRSELARQLEGVTGVRAAVPVHYQPTEMQTGSILVQDLTFMGVDPAPYTEVTSFVFSDTDQDSDAALRQLASGGAVFVSSVLSEKYGLVVGDTISLRTPGGNKAFEVAGVVVDFYNQGLVITGNWQDMRRYFRVNEASTILVRAEDPNGIEAVRETIEAQYGNRYRLSIEANTAVKERIFTLMDQAFSMFDLMAVLAVAVASMGVVNTLTMNIMERTREIGMLRAIGMTPRQVVRMVLAESALMGIIGGALGLAFGVFLSRIFLLGMTAMSGYKLTLTVPPTGIILGLIVALVMSQLVAIQPARRAARINVLEAVRYE